MLVRVQLGALIKSNIMSRTVKKSYTGSKRFDKTCRNHGGCPYCEGNRTYSNRKRKEQFKLGLVSALAHNQ